MKRNAFGQLVLPPFVRTFADQDGTGGSGDDDDKGGKDFTPPASQEELDRIINKAVGRTHKQYEGVKEKAQKWDDFDAKRAGDDDAKTGERPSGVSESDVDKRIADALAAKDKELAIERVSDRLDKALEGRSFSASKLFSLDRSEFVKEDGKTVDADAIKDWVEKNSTAVEAPSNRRLRAQGGRSAGANGGSAQAGRDLFAETHKKSGKD
ncbi:hypothetical protein GCM10010910_01280 [Microbacterium nanhaiense]|uniref:Scaffolding protein n=1 Tax=Microbacterium nanhaiense TaxID=1301026 RepID=A0ABQ2MZZ7_9MICO|nr:hypothetical protein [Microbacterium nanhaiense]GGO59104.1 hypothetical protein GCM10010910_01280 [Microbacterium nanhaiense]